LAELRQSSGVAAWIAYVFSAATGVFNFAFVDKGWSSGAAKIVSFQSLAVGRHVDEGAWCCGNRLSRILPESTFAAPNHLYSRSKSAFAGPVLLESRFKHAVGFRQSFVVRV
jgi:hypothetical protein